VTHERILVLSDGHYSLCLLGAPSLTRGWVCHLSKVSVFVIFACVYRNIYTSIYNIYSGKYVQGLLSVQALWSRLCLNLFSLSNGGSIITWTVVGLTAAKFKGLIYAIKMCINISLALTTLRSNPMTKPSCAKRRVIVISRGPNSTTTLEMMTVVGQNATLRSSFHTCWFGRQIKDIIQVSIERIAKSLHKKILSSCEISSSHGGEYEVQNCLLGCTAV
jgi:hypothetical protein